MKTYLTIAFLLATFVAFAQQQQMAKVIKEDAVLKGGSSIRAATIANLPIGTEIILISERATYGFYGTSYQGQRGFVHEKFIEFIEPAIKPPPYALSQRPVDFIHELEAILQGIAKKGEFDSEKYKLLFTPNARIVNDLTNTSTLVDIDKYFEDFSIAYLRALPINVAFFEIKESNKGDDILVNYTVQVAGTLRTDQKPQKKTYRRVATFVKDSKQNLKIANIVTVSNTPKKKVPLTKGKKKPAKRKQQ